MHKTEDTMALIGGALLGAAAMYFLDPQSGERRRQRIAASAEEGMGTARDTAAHQIKSFSHRARNLAEHLGSETSGAGDHAADYAHSLADQAHDIASDLAGRAAKYIPGDPRSAMKSGRHWGEKWFSRAQSAYADGRDAAHGYADAVGHHAQAHGAYLNDLGHRWWDRARDFLGSAPSMAAGHAQHLRDQAADRSDNLRRMAAKRISQASHRAQGWLGHDEDHGVGAGTVISSTAGCLVVGAGLMYLLDPEKGSDRRSWMMRKVTACMNKTGQSMRSMGGDLAEKLWGKARDADMRARSFVNRKRIDSEQLVRQIRTQISHLSDRAQSVQLLANADGDVIVTGDIRRDEVDQLLEILHGVPGVSHVINRMTISGERQSASPTAQ